MGQRGVPGVSKGLVNVCECGAKTYRRDCVEAAAVPNRRRLLAAVVQHQIHIQTYNYFTEAGPWGILILAWPEYQKPLPLLYYGKWS